MLKRIWFVFSILYVGHNLCSESIRLKFSDGKQGLYTRSVLGKLETIRAVLDDLNELEDDFVFSLPGLKKDDFEYLVTILEGEKSVDEVSNEEVVSLLELANYLELKNEDIHTSLSLKALKLVEDSDFNWVDGLGQDQLEFYFFPGIKHRLLRILPDKLPDRLGCVVEHILSLVEYPLHISIQDFIDAGRARSIDAGGCLDLRSMRISDLKGLENIPNIKRVRSIWLFNNKLQKLPKGVFDELNNLTHLDLSLNKLKVLPDGIFNRLGNFEDLDLSNNQFVTLPDNIFDSLVQLEALDLSGNQLGALSDGIFGGLVRLGWLGLSDNQLTALPNDIFNRLGNLTYLNLRNNQFVTLSKDIFDRLVRLKWLDLRNNQLVILSKDIFDRFNNLTYLNLSNNQFVTLSKDIFDRLVRLKWLDLRNNQLVILSKDIFDRFNNLTYLNLSNNQLTALPNDIFNRLGNLIHLSLDDNQLISLSDGIFDRLVQLKWLDLRNNQFVTLPDGIFDNLVDLKKLDLSRNPLNQRTNQALREQMGTRLDYISDDRQNNPCVSDSICTIL